jgi:hypothetical protein
MENFENRTFMVFNVDELAKIDFNQVSETSAETVRKSFDGTRTFVKWEGDTPECVTLLTTGEGPYSHAETLAMLSTPEWAPPISSDEMTAQ